MKTKLAPALRPTKLALALRPSKLALALAALGCAGAAAAQGQYPAKPIRILVGFAPGGSTEILARIIGQRLGETWQQQVVVDTRPGANGAIATELAAKSPADGYTLLMAAAGHTVNVSLNPKLGYHPVRDFAALSQVAMLPNLLVVHPSLPVRSVRDLIQLARARPDEMSHGSSGIGSPGHLSGEVFKLMTKVRFVHVAYKGSSQALIDLLGGHVQIAFPTVVAAMVHLRSGKLRPLGVTSAKRSSALPETPTIAEAGVPGYEVAGWYGMFAPAGVPQEIHARLGNEIARIVRSEAVRERLLREGAEPVGTNPDEFARFVVADVEKWAKVVAAVGIGKGQ